MQQVRNIFVKNVLSVKKSKATLAHKYIYCYGWEWNSSDVLIFTINV